MTDLESEQIRVSIGEYTRGSKAGVVNETLSPSFLTDPDKHHFIVFPGDGIRNAGDANLIGHWVDKWLPPDADADIYSCYYDAPGPQLQQARTDLISSVGESWLDVIPYQSRYKDFFDSTFHNLLYDQSGTLRPVKEIQNNLRNVTLVGWCHGSTVGYELEQYLISHLRGAGITEQEIDKTMRNLSILNFNPREPVHSSKATVLEVLPLSDPNLQRSFQTDIVYNKAQLANMVHEMTGETVMPDRFYVMDEVVGSTVFQNDNKTLLMPTSVTSSDGQLTHGNINEHAAIDELLTADAKQSREARAVVHDFLEQAVNSSEEIEVRTQLLDRNWERRQGEFLLPAEVAETISLYNNYERISQQLSAAEGRLRNMPAEELMLHLSKKEQMRYRELAEKAHINIGSTDPSATCVIDISTDEVLAFQKFDRKLRERCVDSDPGVIRLRRAVASSKRDLSRRVQRAWVRDLAPVGTAAAHLTARAGLAYAATWAGQQFQDWESERKKNNLGELMGVSDNTTLAAQKANLALTTGGLVVAGSGAVIAVAAKRGAKFVATKGGQVAAKSIPIVGTIVGIGYAAIRAWDGDWTGMGLELASAGMDIVSAAGVLTGPGEGAILASSVALDSYIALRDGMMKNGECDFAMLDDKGNSVLTPDGQPILGARINYKHDVKQGPATFYNLGPNGSYAAVVGQYENDKREGQWITVSPEWDPNHPEEHILERANYEKGKLISFDRVDEEGHLIAQLKNGQYIEYWTDENGISTGKVKCIGQYDEDGKRTGHWITVSPEWDKEHPEEHVLECANFEDDRLVGEYFRLDANENVIAKGNFSDGEYMEYWIDGNGLSTGIPKYEGRHRNGQSVGDWTVHSPDGEVAAIVNYDKKEVYRYTTEIDENGNERAVFRTDPFFVASDQVDIVYPTSLTLPEEAKGFILQTNHPATVTVHGTTLNPTAAGSFPRLNPVMEPQKLSLERSGGSFGNKRGLDDQLGASPQAQIGNNKGLDNAIAREGADAFEISEAQENSQAKRRVRSSARMRHEEHPYSSGRKDD